MKSVKLLSIIGLFLLAITIAACSNSSTDSGTVSMSITDAKPLLPENVTNLFVEFSEVWVHKSGGGWQQLDLVETPYTIDLLQFQDLSTTEFVPPATLDSGKYTQVRIVVDSANLIFGDDIDNPYPLEIPSENLKTDKNFTIDVEGGTAVDIVIHFDLSMSVVATGTGDYQMKPVLHLFEDVLQAAVITGRIDNAFFDNNGKATVTVLHSIGEGVSEIYTEVEIEETNTDGQTWTEFSIFWLVPNQAYSVEIDGNSLCSGYFEDVPILEEGEEYFLNVDENGNSDPVPIITDECPPAG